MPSERSAPLPSVTFPGGSDIKGSQQVWVDEEFCKRTLIAKGFDDTVRSRWMGCKMQMINEEVGRSCLHFFCCLVAGT